MDRKFLTGGVEMKNMEGNEENCTGGLEGVNRFQGGTGGVDLDLKEEKRPVLNARRGVAKMIVDIAFGKSSDSKEFKRGSVGYLLDKIQKILRLVSLAFSLVMVIFIITSRVNKGRKSILGSLPAGSLGRSIKFDMILDEMNQGSLQFSTGGEHPISDATKTEDEVEESGGGADFRSEILDDPDYWADDNDRDLWEDDADEYYEVDIIDSEEVEESEKNEPETTLDEKGGKVIEGRRNKGLRSKGVEISLPSSLTVYGRVSQEDSYINGVYNIIQENKADGKKYPKLHHGRAVYKKEGSKKENGETIPTLFIVFDGRHEFWTINSSLGLDSKPLAFLPDHGLIPIRHVGPYGAHSNSAWVFRSNSGISKDTSVRIVENSSIENQRVPVHITKATHSWHIKHHKLNKESSHKLSGSDNVKLLVDPYSTNTQN
ncbi:membrane associated protein [Cryptosporidium felis]|nr:membrane associated protein [Cryptosporidium felis]